jgi:hypothetical protein
MRGVPIQRQPPGLLEEAAGAVSSGETSMTRKLSQKEQMAYSTIARLEAERDQLQRDLTARDDKLDERDALLRSLDDAWNSHDGKERFGALMFKVEEVVSASAEPSAPVEIDHDALVAAVCVLRSQGLGNLSAAVEEARTALERKPS